MNQSTTLRRLAPLLLILGIAILLPLVVSAQAQPPTIPHPVEGRDACLTCHEAGVAGAPKIPDNHTGRTNEMCRMCHQVGAAEGTTTAIATTTSSPSRTPSTTPTKTITPLAAAATTKTPTAPTTESTPTNTSTPTTAATKTATASPTTEPTAQAESPTTPTQAGAPAIPHSLEGRENCLECHTLTGATPVESVGGPPAIPHSLVGRENCLACHQEGIGGAPRVPADHAGRTSEMCQGCHQPSQTVAEPTTTPPTEPIPTPLVHPTAEGVNTCLDCHKTLPDKQAEMAAQWERSVHAERGVSCADCHGGDPSATTVDAAMSPEAGYIGAPAKADIPALCASCHSDVSQMRQYDLPTDQYAKYKESIHGTKLAEGDTNVATCYDCHGGHQVLKANDPASTVYMANVPEMCASCHADTNLMAPYHIPTNQYDLYRQSVHGIALLENQDFRAPNCATCHGTHGAAPPGFEEVANVCGSCHSATQDYYLTSAHADGGDEAPKCVTCHGRYDVGTPSEAMFQGVEPRHCGSCHAPDTLEGQVAQSMYNSIDSAAQAYTDAEAAVRAASDVGMLVAEQEALLQQANTDLVTARAAQHTLNTEQAAKLSDQAKEAADQAKAGAEAAVEATVMRRRAMIIAIAAIAITIVALYMLKRVLDRRLEARS